jgi:hypothetical protein
VEAALTRSLRGYLLPAAAVLMVAFIGVLAFTGKPPSWKDANFKSEGIVASPPSSIVRIELTQGKDRSVFHRIDATSWAFDQSTPTRLPDELASHLEAALRFMHVSAPTRTIDPAEYQGSSFADFGLDPPAYVVSLVAADHSTIVANFGKLNPSGTSQYVRLLGQPTLYLLSRYVGAEWQLAADMAKRLLPPNTGSRAGAPTSAARFSSVFLPTSIDQVWAVEIVYGGALHRFERDSSGNWFLHVGHQHSHVPNSAHVADPAKAPIIAAALEGFDQTQIERLVAHHSSGGDVERYGLNHPALIALLYARDSSSPLARIEIGSMAEDGFSRYARLSQDGEVVQIAAYEADRLIGLLKAVGAAP